MKSRLFWKIFLTFCAVFFGEFFLIWGMVYAFAKPEPTFEQACATRVHDRVEHLAGQALSCAGPAQLGSKATSGPGSFLQVTPATDEAAGQPGTVVRAPDGTRWRIAYAPPPEPERGGPPFVFYLMGMSGGLVFATIAALYLARPIRTLKQGFKSFAHGELDTRLAVKMGGRKDEIAELAVEFDGMAEQIERLIRSRDQLIDDVSHEIRSPLARLQLAIALARQRPETGLSSLDRIEQEGKRLNDIAEALLTLSRLEAGAPGGPKYFDLKGLLEEVIEDVSFEAQPRGAQVTANWRQGDLTAAPIVMAGESGLLRRAFENVLRNSLRFTPSGCAIRVSLHEEGEWVTVMIDDDGPGVPEDIADLLFEPFKRGASDGDGYGLGLAIARRAVLVHGGTIGAENMRPTGLRVSFTLPLCKPDALFTGDAATS